MDITKEDIVDWALNYADYGELEETSKALYSIYVQEREKLGIQKPQRPKKKPVKLPDSVYWRHKKGQPKEAYPGMNGPVTTRKI